MRILQVSKFYPPDRGGIEAVARDLSAGFVRHGLQVRVLCAGRRAATVREVDDLGVSITRAGSLGTWLSTSMAPALLRELHRQRHDADIVHVHMPDPLAAMAVWIGTATSCVSASRATSTAHWSSGCWAGPMRSWPPARPTPTARSR
jgi:hypothetical protein